MDAVTPSRVISDHSFSFRYFSQYSSLVTLTASFT
ncbi:Uncharacterised protein [Vibrio cholerae]|nr:Uncharacterised protein [Vibrio cholerae]CSI92878.1 Uncharacterised protein [Vibrio cholerae]